MTRESWLHGCNEYSCDDQVKIEAVKIVINMIYDDLESRTCENCVDNDTEWGGCDLLQGTPTDGFGCNQFERK